MLRADQNAAPRVTPLAPPYSPDLQAVFDKIMPPGVSRLTLFTTLARVPRIWDRFRAGSLLDRSPVSLRHREIVIDRTCARCGCDYEWGVHVAYFADRAALTPEQVRATVRGGANDPAWSGEELLLIRLVDELHDAADISGQLWKALATAFSIEQIFELIALVGFYHTVSFFANGLRLGAEPSSAPPPAA
jgi:alkylhydroperoxidase family enzyme